MPPLSDEWRNAVVICGGMPWASRWSSECHVARHLRPFAPVVYIDPPTAVFHPKRGLHRTRVDVVDSRFAVVQPAVLPGSARAGIGAATDALTRRAIRKTIAHLGATVSAIVVANYADTFDACPGARHVVYAMDDLLAGASLLGVSERLLAAKEQRLSATADTIVVVSQALADKWRELGHNPVLIPNGVDAEMYAETDEAPLPKDVSLAPPIAGFVGHLSHRIDLDVLEAIAERGISLLLVGSRQSTFASARMDALLARANVCWVGPKPFAELASYLRVIDVGLTPYTHSEFNAASFPLKTLEYLSAGRAAVSTDLPAARWLDTPLLSIASDPEAFTKAVVDALGATRSPELIATRRLFAAGHSWDRRAAEFAAAIGLPVMAG